MVATNPRVGSGFFPIVWGISSCLDFASGHVALEAHHYSSRALELGTTNDEDSVSFAGISMFTSGTLSNLNLTSACEAALYQTVDCADETSSLMTDGYVGSFDNSTVTALVCETSCEASIAQLHGNVSANCGESAELIPGMPFLGLVDMLWSNWNQSCFLDPDTGDNCNDIIAAYPNITDLSELSTSDLCSYCYLEKLALMQADAYSGVYDENWQSVYETVAETCNITVADFNATDSVFNVTVDVSTTNCVSGNTYTTELGDTCDSIALANSVSAATMFYMNSNIVNCSAIAEGTSLCLPLACNSVYTVQENDTCSSIAADSGILTRNVLAYNTQLNWNCTNLQSTNPYWGSTLCVSTPGGTYTGKALNTTSSDGSSAVVDPPTDATVATGSTLDCGEWYVNDGSLTCTQLCLSYEIAINLLTEANPSLNKTTCDADLVVGDAYCIDPLTGWNWGTSSTTNSSTSTLSATATATSAASATATESQSSSATQTVSVSTSSVTSVTGVSTSAGTSATGVSTSPSSTALSSAATPSPTETGAIDTCTTWHYVVSDDTCYSISQEYSISLDDFYEWNTEVGDDCGGLWLNYYVCVGIS